MNHKKASFFRNLSDAMLMLTYYDRKGSDDLSVEDVESMLNSGYISLEEIQGEVAKYFNDSFKLPTIIKVEAFYPEAYKAEFEAVPVGKMVSFRYEQYHANFVKESGNYRDQVIPALAAIKRMLNT